MSPDDCQQAISACVNDLASLLPTRRWVMGTAESCTGGGIAFALTALPGSSSWFCGSAVTYTNALKMQMLGVSAQTLAAHGAVSEAVVTEMADGAIRALGCQLAVAVSGIAGPGGGTESKPVGLVCLGWALVVPEADIDVRFNETAHFAGDRDSVRQQTILRALQGCLRALRSLE